MNDNHEDLLEKLGQDLSCTYLSDLHSAPWRSAVLQAVAALEVTAYPLKQWNGLAAYLTGEKVAFAASEDAKEFILRKLEK